MSEIRKGKNEQHFLVSIKMRLSKILRFSRKIGFTEDDLKRVILFVSKKIQLH